MKLVKIHNEIELRIAAKSIARWAVDAPQGRRPPDPVHEWVTEERRTQWERAHAAGQAWAQGTPYSSCGDLAHALLYLLGCRDERLVNRDSDGGTTPWRAGVNISRLLRAPGYTEALRDSIPPVGSILHVRDPDHVCVLCGVSSGSWQTADYGGPYGVWHQGAVVTADARGHLYVRGRRLVGWLDISQVVRTEQAIVPDDCATYELDQPYAEPWWGTLAG